MSDFSSNFQDISTPILSAGGIIAGILNSNNAVEIAKYQADIAKSQASAEEKKYGLQLAQQRLMELDSQKKDAQKKVYLYVGIGFGVVLIGLAFIFLRKPKVQLVEYREPPLAKPALPVAVPKPVALQ